MSFRNRKTNNKISIISVNKMKKKTRLSAAI